MLSLLLSVLSIHRSFPLREFSSFPINIVINIIVNYCRHSQTKVRRNFVVLELVELTLSLSLSLSLRMHAPAHDL